MPHTAADHAAFSGGILLAIALLAGLVLAVSAGIGILLKIYRSLTAVYVSSTLAGIAAIPVLFSIIIQGKFLFRDGLGLLFVMIAIVILAFAGIAPILQYRHLNPED